MTQWLQLGKLVTVLLLLLSLHGDVQADRSQPPPDAAKFVTIVLGAAGGLREDNLTAYLLAPFGDTRFIALDAGTLLAGLKIAKNLGSFDDIQVPPESSLSLEGWVLHEHIKAYAISHAHLDHISGLILNSTDDTSKPILGGYEQALSLRA